MNVIRGPSDVFKCKVVVCRRMLFEKPEASWTSDHSLVAGFLVEIVDMVKPEPILGEVGKTDEILGGAALVKGLLLLMLVFVRMPTYLLKCMAIKRLLVPSKGH